METFRFTFDDGEQVVLSAETPATGIASIVRSGLYDDRDIVKIEEWQRTLQEDES